jgi:hypothetical protein
MKYFPLYLILFFAITFVSTQRPKNIRIFNTENKNGKLFYEFTVFKNETFGIQFERGRGTAYYWEHLNDSLSKEQKPIIFLNTRSYFWADDRVPQTEIIYDLFSNKTRITPNYYFAILIFCQQLRNSFYTYLLTPRIVRSSANYGISRFYAF